MTHDDPLHLMEKTGGSFVRSLADCYLHADEHNKRRLREAFADVFERYETLWREEAVRAAVDKVERS